MLSDLIFAFWFFVPAGAANMAPVFAAQVPFLKHLNAPMDFGATLRGKPILGPHKTWRGLVVGVVVATLVLWLQQTVVRHLGWFATPATAHNYLGMSLWLAGPAFAIGALGGDAIKSFVKRQKNIASGGAWLPYDLVDHIVGAIVLSLPFATFKWWIYVTVIIVWSLANFAVSYVGYLVGVKERPM